MVNTRRRVPGREPHASIGSDRDDELRVWSRFEHVAQQIGIDQPPLHRVTSSAQEHPCHVYDRPKP
ncbi:hypothetical protein ASF58_11900 [Methylobacterium sp. Leaf125]|nr:hypothetical protein ASF58_11900 [Methylobacterium sp. Leaf125]